MPVTVDSCTITNVTSGECIGLERQIQIAYTNFSPGTATIDVICSGGTVTPAPASAPGANGTATVVLTHTAAGGTHTIYAYLKHNGSRVAGDVVRVSVGNPCPISIDGPIAPDTGVPKVSPEQLITGKYNKDVGKQVFVFVEEQQLVNGLVTQPRLVFVGEADIQPGAGTWRHAAIPGAQAGQFLRAALAKDGVIKSMVRGIYI